METEAPMETVSVITKLQSSRFRRQCGYHVVQAFFPKISETEAQKEVIVQGFTLVEPSPRERVIRKGLYSERKSKPQETVH